MSGSPRRAEATPQTLHRIFTVPEGDASTLARIEAEISSNLQGFLQDHIVATDAPMAELEAQFASNASMRERFAGLMDRAGISLTRRHPGRSLEQ